MPPKKTDGGDGKMMSADTFSAFMAIANITSVNKAHFELMSALDGERTVDGYQHIFRSVVAKAKELRQRLDAGEKFVPVPPGGKKGGATSGQGTPATPNKRKTADINETPSKKPKAAPRKKRVATPEEDPTDDFQGEGLPVDAREIIKAEENWENAFV